MLGLLITIGLIVLSFKLCWWSLKLCGKLLGGIFSIVGYILIGVLGVTVFGLAVAAIPIILVIGVVAIAGCAARI